MCILRHLSLSWFCCLVSFSVLAQANTKKRTPLPAVLPEVSGLVFAASDSLWWHNDGGHAAHLYLTDNQGRIVRVDTLAFAKNVDWEDLTTDRNGHLFIGDFGNNLGQRSSLRIYRYQPHNGQIDSIDFRFPGQTGAGRTTAGNYDTEAFFFDRDSLHLFTKDLLPQSQYLTKHFVLPAQPGNYVAQLRDSISLRRRVVTSAAIAPDGRVAVTAYYYRFWLGFIPLTAANVYTITDYPPGRYLQGQWHKQKLSCFFPTQYEAVDFFQNHIFTATERTPLNRQKMKRKKIKK